MCVLGVSEYAEYKEENLELEHSDSHTGLDSTAVSDNPETRARRRAHGEHMEKRRISESSVREKSERRRHVSKSELQRQLSKQVKTYSTYLRTVCIMPAVVVGIVCVY